MTERNENNEQIDFIQCTGRSRGSRSAGIYASQQAVDDGEVKSSAFCWILDEILGLFS